MNAKKEMLELLEGRKVKCAWFALLGEKMTEEQYVKDLLEVGYTDEDYEEFLKRLDFSYFNGYGVQELFGLIWFEDGDWADRKELNGKEYWRTHTAPEIPEDLLPNQ